MALHRNIYWIGRQWAVTGFGMQAVNQKHGGEFDVAIENLWDDDPRIVLRGQKWFNPEDFAKGLAVAQARFPRPANKPAPLPVEMVLQASAQAAPTPPILPVTAPIELPAAVDVPAVVVEAPAEPKLKGPPPSFTHMSVLGQAKLSRVWRAQRRR